MAQWYTTDIQRIYSRYVEPGVAQGKTIQQVLSEVFKTPMNRVFKEQVISYSESRRPPSAITKKDVPKETRRTNLKRVREVYGKIPGRIREKLEKLPFTVRDVKVLSRTSKYGLKGDITFRGSDDKTYAIQQPRGRKK